MIVDISHNTNYEATIILQETIFVEDAFILKKYLNDLLLKNIKTFVFDLEKVTYIDCAFISVLTYLKNKMYSNIIINNVSKEFKDHFDIWQKTHGIIDVTYM